MKPPNGLRYHPEPSEWTSSPRVSFPSGIAEHGARVGVDNAWEQKKTRSQPVLVIAQGKILENSDDWAREQPAATVGHTSARALGLPSTCPVHIVLVFFQCYPGVRPGRCVSPHAPRQAKPSLFNSRVGIACPLPFIGFYARFRPVHKYRVSLGWDWCGCAEWRWGWGRR